MLMQVGIRVVLVGTASAWLGLAGSASIAAPPTPRETYEKADKNNDGKLTINELPSGARPLFAQTDADRNGSISLDEFVEFLRKNVDPNATETKVRKPEETTHSLLDIAYADTDHPRQRLDLFLPKSPQSKSLPLVVYIHGGGWVHGDKEQGRPLLLPYVTGGEFAVASIAYRFSSDAIWPAQIHDCKAAIRWLRAHSKEHGIDPARIGVMGASAGGHLASLLGTTGGVRDLEGELGSCREAGSEVACVVNYCGPSNLLTMKAGQPNEEEAVQVVSQLLGGPVTTRTDVAKAASAVTYITSKDPPFLITHGTSDELVPYGQSERFHGALKSAGVDSMLIPVRGGKHNILLAPGLNERVRLFFERQLLEKQVNISSGPLPAAP